ncbi:hypothetical protein M378DRAFT_10179 [Amanita muscaria Koide BX008]|uniref:HAT C-terminal dimerisation domain-containing protein n=1 Tax=Amanita muscaria (strain Koide BX008) TaxID=946122 RepID=A0A0C2WWI6_AMAMK|nr:hypothetical protein M378DRAFT_10179 [Amanita muscaria Koide BX008]
MAMILNPKEKMSYFKKHWSTELQGDVMKCIEEVFKEQYLLLGKDSDPQESMKSKKAKKGLRALLRELSDNDEDNTTDTCHNISEDPERPWSQYFQAYMDISEQVPDGWSVIKWWGVNSSCYHPAWASLAHDYLSIMSSSVSSERAFSQGGITISKRRNRLKGDIVEALQCVKSPSSILEAEFNDDSEDNKDGEDGEDDGEGSETAGGWDALLIDEDDGALSGMDPQSD